MMSQRINHHAKADWVFQQSDNVAKLNAVLGVMRDGAD
jgi:hypothetical protein